jgi:hypothetical protein
MAIGSFDNPITGGGGALTINQICSPNFSLADQTGWAILKNGDAYFFDVTATGEVSANTVVVSGSGDGLFVYEGLPGPGTLMMAIVAAAGTDKYGNSYSGPGLIVSAAASPFGNEIQIRPDKNAMFIYAH